MRKYVNNLVIMAAALGAFSSSAALSQEVAALGQSQVVTICEQQPDGIAGNCPPTVVREFQGVAAGGNINQSVADTAVALAERGQRAAASNNIPLCIDLSEGILQTASYSTDPAQRDTIRQLAAFMCCVRLENTRTGVYYGATETVAITGSRQDGSTRAGAATFASASASFVSDGVRPGDILVVQSDGSASYFVISKVVDANTLEVEGQGGATFNGFGADQAGLAYDVRRPDPKYAETSCTPGFATAATPVVPSPSASPQ